MPATASTARHPRTNTLRLSEGPLRGSTARTKGSAGPLRGSTRAEQELCGRGLRTQRATCGRVRTSRGPAERSLCHSTPQHIRRGGWAGYMLVPWFQGQGARFERICSEKEICPRITTPGKVVSLAVFIQPLSSRSARLRRLWRQSECLFSSLWPPGVRAAPAL